MRTGLYFVVFLLIPRAGRTEVDTPDTPAGHTLRAFLDAFNSAEHDRIAAYVKEYDPDSSADGLTSFSNQTGGFTLVSIVHSAPDKVSFLAPGRKDNIDWFGILQLASTSPPHVKALSIRAIPPERERMTFSSMKPLDRRQLMQSVKNSPTTTSIRMWLRR